MVKRILSSQLDVPVKPGVVLNPGDTVKVRNWDDSEEVVVLVAVDLDRDLCLLEYGDGSRIKGGYAHFTHSYIAHVG